jgi:hypothetical protein
MDRSPRDVSGRFSKGKIFLPQMHTDAHGYSNSILCFDSRRQAERGIAGNAPLKHLRASVSICGKIFLLAFS